MSFADVLKHKPSDSGLYWANHSHWSITVIFWIIIFSIVAFWLYHMVKNLVFLSKSYKIYGVKAIKTVNAALIKKTIFSFVFALSTFVIYWFYGSFIGTNHFDNWETNYIIPYINSLPTQKTHFINKLTFSSNDGTLNTVVFPYKQKAIKLEDATVKLDLNPNSKPMITFKNNPHDFTKYPITVPEDFHKGIIQVTIHLPENYKF